MTEPKHTPTHDAVHITPTLSVRDGFALCGPFEGCAIDVQAIETHAANIRLTASQGYSDKPHPYWTPARLEVVERDRIAALAKARGEA